MKKKYHIRIDKKDESTFHEVTEHIGVEPALRGIYIAEDGDFQCEQDYTILLSKYELLALRLMCKTGLIKEVEKNPISV